MSQPYKDIKEETLRQIEHAAVAYEKAGPLAQVEAGERIMKGLVVLALIKYLREDHDDS